MINEYARERYRVFISVGGGGSGPVDPLVGQKTHFIWATFSERTIVFIEICN